MKLTNLQKSGICTVCGKELDCIMNIICEDCKKKKRNKKLDFVGEYVGEYDCEWFGEKKNK